MSEFDRSSFRHGIETSGCLLPPLEVTEEDPPEAGMPDAGNPPQDQASFPELLPNTLGATLHQVAERLGIPAEAYYLVLLCVAASLIPSRTRLLTDPHSKFSQPPILWGGLVGDADGGRSRIISTLTRPLKDLQAEHYARYQQRLKNYETPLRVYERGRWSRAIGDPPDRPTPVSLFTSDCTTDAVEQILARQPGRGLLVDLDDLAIFPQSPASCRFGGWSEIVRWRDLYKGFILRFGRGIKDRIPHPSVSVVGRIRQSDLQAFWNKHMRPDDRLWASFAWVKVPPVSDPDTQGGLVHNLRPLLDTVYRYLQASPPMQHVLGGKGQQLWDSWKNEIIELFFCANNRGIRDLLLGTGNRAVRIALVLHRLDAACAGVIPSEVVPANTLARGMEFARWLQRQAEAIFSEVCESIGQ